jgi:adenosylcobinamide-GDP ribazoletransferase
MKTALLSNTYIKSFLLALSLLTRIPIPQLPDLQARHSGISALFYPLVGLIIGGLLCLPLLLFPSASPLLLAAIITVIWTAITGGLHLDGLADSADGWLGGMGDKEKTQRIMKDPLVGAAGVIAIVGVLLLKFAALTTLLQEFQELQKHQHHLWLVILLAPMLGRSMILILFLTTPYARSEGMASSVIDSIPRVTAIIVIASSYLLSVAFSLSGMLFVIGGFFLLRHMMMKHLDGCTGDTAGATVEVSEMFWLLGVAVFL